MISAIFMGSLVLYVLIPVVVQRFVSTVMLELATQLGLERYDHIEVVHELAGDLGDLVRRLALLLAWPLWLPWNLYALICFVRGRT